MVVIISLSSIHSDSVKLRANFKHPTKIQRLLHVQFFSIVVTGKDPPFEDVNVGNNVLSNVIFRKGGDGGANLITRLRIYREKVIIFHGL